MWFYSGHCHNVCNWSINLKKKKLYGPFFYGWGSTASRLEPLWESSLLFTTKFPEIPATHWFWTRDPWIGNPAGSFPDSLKCANVRQIYKKKDPFDKKNYRPVSILALLSKHDQKFIKEWYMSKRHIILNLFSIKFCVDLEKHIVRNMLYVNY